MVGAIRTDRVKRTLAADPGCLPEWYQEEEEMFPGG